MADPLVGFTGGPSFLLPYAETQDGIASPAEYNNLGRDAGTAEERSDREPAEHGHAANGNIVPSTKTGYYTATILGSGQWTFPVGAKMRAVASAGLLQAGLGAGPPMRPTCRHAISVIKEVAGDTARRTVVDAEKCAGCHEWFEAHGGNRVYEAQVCVACHVPGLATSGRSIPDARVKRKFPGVFFFFFFFSPKF